jgi:uncharacterized protein
LIIMINEEMLLPPADELEEICRRHHIHRLSVFGSALTDEFRPESDVDILVEFEEGHVPGFGYATIADELSELFGRAVDLNTPQSLHQRYRERVLRESQPLYAA